MRLDHSNVPQASTSVPQLTSLSLGPNTLCISLLLQPRLLEIYSLSFHPMAQNFLCSFLTIYRGNPRLSREGIFAAASAFCCAVPVYIPPHPSLHSLPLPLGTWSSPGAIITHSCHMALIRHLVKIFLHKHCERG